MASVDDRIVRMEFDNAAFERNVQTTLTSLDKLNKALRFEGATTGLAGVTAAADKVSFQGIAEGIEGLSKKFLALSTIAITALVNITNKAIDAGIQIAKSLSLDQVMAGFQEYELKLGSIQTIMAGSGESLDVVNKKLAELNEYSDKTIYSFKDMTSNIGKFTNAGVDLNTSVAAIQGVANVAAISGANAEEASRAMYNFAQALSKGHVQLVDWKSIELANMGTAEFKQQLIDAAEATGTLTKQGDAWVTAEGNMVTATKGFNESLTDQWLTTDVLTDTLGDYADQTTEIGKKAFAAAQDVKTFSQLMATVKESIGSGWAQTFEILIGNFDEAKALFGEVNTAISGMVGRSADARNNLLQGWKDLGGRTVLIDSIRTAIQNLGEILAPIKDAFREIFPPATAQSLMNMTNSFKDFANALKPSQKTVENLHRIFKGFFAILRIGWEIVSQGAKFIAGLLASVTGAGSGQFLDFVAKIGDLFVALYEGLVKGEGIKDFFLKLTEVVKSPLPFLQELKDKIVDFFTGMDSTVIDKVSDSFGRFGDRFESLKGVFEKAKDLWEPFAKAMQKVGEVLNTAWEAIRDFFQELGQKIADTMGEGDFDVVLDSLNTIFLGGIVALLAKFIKDGFNFDIGAGFLEKIGKSFEELTGVLKAMQTDIKANALLKIAGAIAILTASVLVLSLIDSAALTKALTAMAVGFGQLMATFAILSKLNMGPTSALSFSLLAGGMVILAGAILLLSLAAKSLADLNWEELARGLTGVTILLGILVVTTKLLSPMTGSFIRIGVGLIAIAIALNILAGAVKIFATMSWAEMATGLMGAALGLTIIGLAMRAMPKNIFANGLALLSIAVALNILAGAVAIFATMSWGEMASGFAGVGAGLVIIAGAMRIMPKNMFIQAAGLLMVGAALLAIGTAMKIFGSMSWGEIGTGLTALAGALLILAVAAHAMSGAIVGAIAITIVAAGLLMLAMVIKEFAGISWGELFKGLLGIGIALAALGIAAYLLQPAIPAMLALGAALILIGAGFAMIGMGADMVAKAFATMAKVGKKGSEAFVEALKNMGKAIPAFVTGLAEGLILLIEMIGAAAPTIVEAIGKILSALLDKLVELVPKMGELITTLIETVFEIIQTYIPKLIETGLVIITSLLQGIRDNIPVIVTLVGEIITGFLDAFSTQLAAIVDSIVNLWVTMFTSVAEALGKVSSTLLFGVAAAFISGFVQGLEGAMPGPMSFFLSIPGKILGWIGNVLSTLWQKGTDFISGLWNGITEKMKGVTTFFQNVGSSIKSWLGDTLGMLVDKGYSLISGFFKGIGDRWDGVKNWFSSLDDKIKGAMGDVGNLLKDIGYKILNGLWEGMKEAWNKASSWLGSLPGKIVEKKGPPKEDAKLLVNNGMLIMQGLQGGMEQEWKSVSKWLGQLDPAAEMNLDAGDKMAGIISEMAKQISDMENLNPVITPVLDLTMIARDAKELGRYIDPSYSYAQANNIAATAMPQVDETALTTSAVPGQVSFEQNIYAPKQLSTGDIYKQTRNQIALAKEELNIL